MENDTRQALAILAFIIFGPGMLWISIKDVTIIQQEIRVVKEDEINN